MSTVVYRDRVVYQVIATRGSPGTILPNPSGNNGKVLGVSANKYAFVAASSGAVPSGGTINQVLKKLSSTDFDMNWEDESGGGGSGTVTSLGDFSPLFTVTTRTTTPVFVAVNQAKNLFYSGPSTGTNAVPTFRVIALADLPGGITVAWGGITGTLSAQADLQNALNLKAPLDSPTFTTVLNVGDNIELRASTGAANFAGGAATIDDAGSIVCATLNSFFFVAIGGGNPTLAVAGNKTVTVSNTVTFTSTDGATLAIGGGGTLGSNAYTSTAYQPLDSDLTSWALITRASGFDTFATAPTSANLKALLTDETGSGAAVFGTAPTIAGGSITALTALAVRSTGAAFDLTFASSEVLTAGRALSIVLGDTARTLTFTANASIGGTHSGTSSGTNTGDQTSVSGNAGTATALATPRAINGVNFDGTAAITVAAAAGTLTGSTLAAGVTASSLTSLGTIVTGVWNGTALVAAYLPALNAITSPTGDLSLNSHKITSLTTGTADTDAVNVGQLNAAVAALDEKAECAGATATALAAATYANGSSGVGATLTLTVSAVLVIDGYTPALNDRLLIKNQTSAFQNGIYRLTTVGVLGVTQAVLTRATDFDQVADNLDGAITFISNGSTNGNTRWQCSTTGTITFGSTNINWSQFSGAVYTADETTIHLSGTTFNVIAGVYVAIAGLGTNVATALAIAQDGTSVSAIGYLGIPQNSKSAAYTTVMADDGKMLFHPAADTTARIWTIDSNANVAYPIGACVGFDNEHGAGAVTIAITADTLELVGAAGSTGSRTLASGGRAFAWKVTSTKWRISGSAELT